MANTALGRTETAYLTNKSGGSVALGDVVIVDTANASAFTTTTTSAYTAGRIGVVIEPNGIANNGSGLVAFGGYVSTINLSGTGSIGDLIKTHTVAKQAVRHASPQVVGDFAQVLGTTATPAALLFGTVQLGGSATTFGPWLVDIIPMISAPSATTGTWGLANITGDTVNYPFVNSGASVGATLFFNSSNAQNDAVSWDTVFSAGTWNVDFHVRKSSNTAIITLNIDGSSAGTVDTYAASAAYAKVSITGFSISSDGKHTVQLKAATRNASNTTGWEIEVFGISFRRTA